MAFERNPRPKTFLFISQVFVPDPTSVGQHMADAASGLVERGFRVKVLTSQRGYIDPAQKYPRKSDLDGVEVRRLPLASLGKSSLFLRVVAQLIFLVQATLVGLFTRDLHAVFISTSPPMAGLAGIPISAIRRVPLKFWAMDINPDQAIALGAIPPGHIGAKALDLVNRRVLERSDVVVTLDENMGKRLNDKAELGPKLHILPPWPHDDYLDPNAPIENGFRQRHGLQGKFIVMYSGNHSLAHPLSTLLDAARRMRHRDDIRFVFVGDGLAKKEVEEAIHVEGCDNIVSLPYQPLALLGKSLAAADVHAVTMGDEMVGCVHPTKVYGVLATARPVLYVGPSHSHIGELISRHGVGWQFGHGEAESLTGKLEAIVEMPREELQELGREGARLISEGLSRATLQKTFLDIIATEGGGLP